MSTTMALLKKQRPSIDDFRAWLDEERDIASGNFQRMNMQGSNGLAAHWANRQRYVEAGLEMLRQFEENQD